MRNFSSAPVICIISPKALQLLALIRLASERHIVRQAIPTFWYNRTNDCKGAKFGTNEADII